MDSMLNKGARTIRRVAHELCGVAVGAKIPTVSELEVRCDASRGNIQKALIVLKETGAVHLEPHGQNGTFLTGIDYLKLARTLGTQHLVGVMPLPYTLRYEGLATALYTLLNSDGVRAFITFLRGSEARVQMLLDKHADYAVMSRMAFDEYAAKGLPIEAALECAPLSYVGQHVLLSTTPQRTDWTDARVGIDDSSADQSILTHRYFADTDVQYVPVQYMHIVEMLLSGDIDVGIWNEDDIHVHASGLVSRALESQETQDGNTRAVIAVRADDPFTRQLVCSLASHRQIEKIQKEVMEGRLAARY